MEYLHTGCDLRNREYIESLLIGGLKYGAALAYILSKDNNDTSLDSVTSFDIDAYIMLKVKEFPALLPLRHMMRSAQVSSNMRSGPKQNTEGDYIFSIILFFYVISKKTNFFFSFFFFLFFFLFFFFFVSFFFFFLFSLFKK